MPREAGEAGAEDAAAAVRKCGIGRQRLGLPDDAARTVRDDGCSAASPLSFGGDAEGFGRVPRSAREESEFSSGSNLRWWRVAQNDVGFQCSKPIWAHQCGVAADCVQGEAGSVRNSLRTT